MKQNNINKNNFDVEKSTRKEITIKSLPLADVKSLGSSEEDRKHVKSDKLKINESIPSSDKKFNENDKKDSNTKDIESNNDEDDDIISKLIGNYGLWQFTWTFILSFFQVDSSFHMYSIIFQSADKEYWCARPTHLQHSINKEQWINLTQSHDRCSILNFDMNKINANNYEEVIENFTAASTTNNLFRNCDEFEYANDIINGETIIEEWNLICDRSQWRSVIEMCFLAGVAVGSLTSGWISDNFGRKHVLMGFVAIQSSIGTLMAFVKSLPLFIGLRFIMGFASMTVNCVSFVLAVELVGGKYQTIIGILIMLPVAMTYTISSGIAYLTQDWRLMQFIISIPWIFILLIWYCIPESPRWLLEEGKIEKLKIVLKKASRMNGKKLDENYEKMLIFANNTKEEIPDPFLMVFRKEYRTVTILTLIQWFSLVIVYYGLALHIAAVGGNLYINTAISGAVESFAILLSIPMVFKFGLRKNLIGFMILSSIACLILNFLPQHYEWVKISLAICVKSAAGVANFLIPIFTALQYPSVIRNLGMGIGNFGSGVALILVPYMWLLHDVGAYIPFIIMGIGALIGALSIYVVKSDSKKIT